MKLEISRNMIIALFVVVIVSILGYFILVYYFRKGMYAGVWKLTADFVEAMGSYTDSILIIYPSMEVENFIVNYDEAGGSSTSTDKFNIGIFGKVLDSEVFEDAKISMDMYGTIITITDNDGNLLGEYYKDNTVEIKDE